jgi:hypothetical protein
VAAGGCDSLYDLMYADALRQLLAAAAAELPSARAHDPNEDSTMNFGVSRSAPTRRRRSTT